MTTIQPTTAVEQSEGVTIHRGATINGVQIDTQVIMARKGYDKWPNAATAIKDWAAKVKAMDCKDYKMPIKELCMSPINGGFFHKHPDNSMPATKTAYTHLMSYIKEKEDNATNCMLDMPPRLRAAIWEEYKSRSKPRDIVLRHALSGYNDQRIARAFVSELHSQANGDDLMMINSLQALANSAPDSKMRVVRQWDYTHFEIVLPTVALKVGKGNMLYGKIDGFNSETKGGKARFQSGSFNLTCLNGAVAAGDSSDYSIKHIGDISYVIHQSLEGAIGGVQQHMHQFSKAYETLLTHTRAESIEAFITHHELPETTGTAINALWDVDGERAAGDTLAGLVNAVTRFAQSQPVREARTLEALAGQTLETGLIF